jgi:hypothetical protein
MLELDKLYRIFYLETNAAFPWLGTEYSLVRRTPCHRVEDLSEKLFTPRRAPRVNNCV